MEQNLPKLPKSLEAFPEVLAALAVYREAAWEPYEGKVAVARVIRNRQLDKRWPNALDEVVLQPFQFSSFNAKDPQAVVWPRRKKEKEWAAFEECCKAVEDSKTNDPVDGAVLYHADYVNPWWAKKSTFIKQIGAHRFYK